VEFPLINHLGESVSHNRRKNEGRRAEKKPVEEVS
jgi:hypothetical protein